MENKRQLLEVVTYTPATATNYTIDGNKDVVRVDGTTAVATLTLPAPAQTRGEITIAHVVGVNYTVVKNYGGAAFHTFTSLGHIHCVSDGTQWLIVK